MLELSWSVEGGEVVHRRLGITAEGVKSFKTPLGWIGRDLMKVTDVNFASRGALFGGWAPRKPQYGKGGVRIDTWPLLEKTGRMRRSFTQTVTNTQLKIGNSAPYFVYHQSNAPRTRLPRRVMLKLRRQEADLIVKSFQQYIISILRQRGER